VRQAEEEDVRRLQTCGGLALVSAVVAAILTPTTEAAAVLLLWLAIWLPCCGLLLLVRRFRWTPRKKT
jgi:hypothetical protein